MNKKFIITNNQEEVQSWLDLGYEIEKMLVIEKYGDIAIYLSKKENDKEN